MATKVLTATLSQSSIQNLIDDLNRYKESLFDKNELFVKRLAEVGIPVIDERIESAKGDSDKSHYTRIDVRRFQEYSQAVLVVDGIDLLFIEFGAGIHYNTPAGTSPHPKGEELGYTIGSYGKGKGKQDKWSYIDKSGSIRWSHGTQATMPVYMAGLEMRDKMIQIAREVFGYGK
jgi:hypothetical protein